MHGGLPRDAEPAFADYSGRATKGNAGHADQIALRAQDNRGQAESDRLPAADCPGEQPIGRHIRFPLEATSDAVYDE